VDVSNLTDEECNKIINVISKDILIRKSEKERASYLNKKFEDLRREILIGNQRRKKRYSFDDYCLICGKHLFTFCCFLHRGAECVSCEHFCCTSCRKTLLPKDNTSETFYICNLCLQKRHLKFKTSEWFYELFQKRFKRFGSAKVLRAIYKQRKSIEPRVITLLALCRVIQPSRVHSVPSLGLRSKSQDDTTIPYSTHKHRTSSADSAMLLHTMNSRKRSVSESDAETELNGTNGSRRSASEADIRNIREVKIETDDMLPTKGCGDDDDDDAKEPLLRKHETKTVAAGEEGSDGDDFRISQSEDTLDEWIAEGYETTVVDEEDPRPYADVIGCADGGVKESLLGREEIVVAEETPVECSDVIPLMKFEDVKEESIDKEDYDEVKQTNR